MNIRAASLTLPLLGALGACYPIEQAALVYSSSHQIGVGVVAGTPETPGLVVNVGYRSLNAAYVPVAVAKHCPRGSEQTCSQITYQLMRLAGGSHQGFFSSSDADTVAALRTAVDNYQTAKNNLDQAIQRDERLLERIRGAPERLQVLGQEAAAIQARTDAGTASAEDATRQSQVTAEMAELRALESADTVSARLESNRRELTTVERNLASDTNRLNELLGRQELRNDDHTEDAYSVFGSFNGSAQGSSTSAGIVAGQIFSTGVAAQHLTRGMRDSAIATACLGAVGELAEQLAEAERNAFIRDAIGVCRRSSDGKNPPQE